jgi:hypothetical protein
MHSVTDRAHSNRRQDDQHQFNSKRPGSAGPQYRLQGSSILNQQQQQLAPGSGLRVPKLETGPSKSKQQYEGASVASFSFSPGGPPTLPSAADSGRWALGLGSMV